MTRKTFVYRVNIESSDSTRKLSELELQLDAVTEQVKAAKKANDGKTYEKLRREQIALQETVKAARKEVRDQAREFKATKFPADSLIGLQSQYAKLRREIQRTSQTDSRFKELQQEAKKLSDRINDTKKSFGDFTSNIGRYEESISSALQSTGGLLRGDISGFVSGLGGLPSVEKVTAAIGPYGVALGAAVAGTAKLTEYIIDLTQEYEKLNSQVQNLTGLDGLDLNRATVGVKTLADVFEQDFNEVLLAANTLTKEVTGDFDRSLELIKLGFLSSANASGEFLDSIREYSSQVRSAKGDGEEFLEILIRSQQEGIWSDKGIDLVKDFTERVKDQSEATRESLENAFGREFTKNLFDNINDGSVRPIQALTAVSKAIKNTELTANEAQLVIKDVFGQPGIDAGQRFIEILGEVGGNLDDVIDNSNAYIQRQNRLIEATRGLNDEQITLAGQFAGTGFSLEELTIKAQAFGTALLNNVLLNIRAVSKGLKEADIPRRAAGFLGLLGVPLPAGVLFGKERQKILDEDQKKLKETQEGEKAAAEERRQLAIQGKLDIQGLTEERAKLQQAIIEAKNADEDYLELQDDLRKVTDNLRIANELINVSIKKNGEDIMIAATSIKGLKTEVADLRKKMEEAPDSETYKKYYEDLIKKENDLAIAVAQRQRVLDAARFTSDENRDAGNTSGFDTVGTIGSRGPEGFNSLEETVDFLAGPGGLNLANRSELERRQSELNAIAEAEKLNDQLRLQQKNERLDREEKLEKEALAKEQKLQEERLKKFIQDGEKIGRVLGEFAAGRVKNFGEFSKEFLLVALKALQAQIPVFITSIFGAEASKKGILGIPSATIASGILTGLFAAARIAVESVEFAEGGQVPDYSNVGVIPNKQNAPRRPSGDRVLAYLTPGEVVLNEKQQKLGAKLFGRSFLSDMGIPGFDQGGVVAPTPQFVTASQVQTTQSSIGFDQSTIQQLANTVASETAKQVSTAVEEAIYRTEKRREFREDLERRRKF